eukprot:SAG11_NODE_11284_length_771_cov_0.995536_2_plen_124_part_01
MEKLEAGLKTAALDGEVSRQEMKTGLEHAHAQLSERAREVAQLSPVITRADELQQQLSTQMGECEEQLNEARERVERLAVTVDAIDVDEVGGLPQRLLELEATCAALSKRQAFELQAVRARSD